MKELRGMEILYLSWRNKPTAVQKYHTLVIEVSVPEMGNSMLDNSIMVGGELKACSVFNKAYRTIQCYKCHHHGHTTIQCTKEERCGHCAGAHATRSKACAEGHKVKCCVCGGPHNPWRKECPYKKETERILYQRSITPARFPVQRQQYTVINKTVLEPMDTTYDCPELAIDFEGFRQVRDLEQQSTVEDQMRRAQLDETNKRRRTSIHETPVPIVRPIKAIISSQIPPSSQKLRNRKDDRSASPTKSKTQAGTRKRNEEADKGSNYTSANRIPLGDITNRETRSKTVDRC